VGCTSPAHDQHGYRYIGGVVVFDRYFDNRYLARERAHITVDDPFTLEFLVRIDLSRSYFNLRALEIIIDQ
jgi:hypothetical protein